MIEEADYQHGYPVLAAAFEERLRLVLATSDDPSVADPAAADLRISDDGVFRYRFNDLIAAMHQSLRYLGMDDEAEANAGQAFDAAFRLCSVVAFAAAGAIIELARRDAMDVDAVRRMLHREVSD